MIQTKEKIESEFDEKFPHWCTVGPWCNKMIYYNLHVPVFEYLFVTVIQYRYELMCGLHIYNNLHENVSDEMSFGGQIPLTDYSTTDSIESLNFGINLLDTWLKSLALKILYHFCVYQDKMKELFKTNPTIRPTPTPE